MLEVKRGEIYFADLSPISGSEQNGIRPVLVLQNDRGNNCSTTTIVAALTRSISKIKNRQPTHVLIKNCGSQKRAVVLLEQLRTIDQKRLHKHIKTLNENEMKKVDRAIKISLGLFYMEDIT